MAQVVTSGHVVIAMIFSISQNTDGEINYIFPFDITIGKIQVRGSFTCLAVEI